LVAAPASAQIAWDGPSLIGPAAPGGLSMFLVNPDPGDGLGATLMWRRPSGSLALGYRVAVGEGAGVGGDVALAGGIDVSGRLSSSVEDVEVDVMWWSGVGASVGDGFAMSVPLGIVVGWTGKGDDVVFSPYAGGHVSLDFADGPGDTMDLEGVIDLGLDLTLTAGWVVRLGASLGGRDALAIGVRIPQGSDRVRN